MPWDGDKMVGLCLQGAERWLADDSEGEVLDQTLAEMLENIEPKKDERAGEASAASAVERAVSTLMRRGGWAESDDDDDDDGQSGASVSGISSMSKGVSTSLQSECSLSWNVPDAPTHQAYSIGSQRCSRYCLVERIRTESRVASAVSVLSFYSWTLRKDQNGSKM